MMTKHGRREPQIIAFGGCGVTDSWVDPRLFRYIVQATTLENPRVALLATASGDDPVLVSKLNTAYSHSGATPTHLVLDEHPEASKPGFFQHNFDLVHIEGGNTAFLVERLHRSGVDQALYDAWTSGVVMTGTSAGASCWFSKAMSASLFSFIEADQVLSPQRGLGFLPESLCVHYDTSPRRRQGYRASIAAGLEPGYGLDQDAGLHFFGTRLNRVVALRRGRGAHRIELINQELSLSPLPGESLGPLTWAEAADRKWHTLKLSVLRQLQRRLPPKARTRV